MSNLNALDGATLNQLDATDLHCMIEKGISSLVAYLTGEYAWNSNNYSNASTYGVNVYLSYETNPTYANYFSAEQGSDDARAALKALESQNILPSRGVSGIAVYFSVDYDVQPADEEKIIAYFNAIVNEFSGTGYSVGMYGGYNPMNSVKNNCPGVVTFWQTYAWSDGYIHDYVDLYQYSNDNSICGFSVDYDQAINTSYAIAPND
ncbi:MAG: DUF1906 domain-containing protein [Alicyclobacillaceae bacterium]|nr:DUF1906 domain-containing protein [Alicyclobacillaceae bacterium]